MNRIDRLFKEKGKNILSVYMTAGYPEQDSTESLLVALQNNRVDLVEIGMPFSDPLADGPVLQASNQRALENGMSLKLLFRQLTGIRDKIDIPLILMGYLNPVLQYGIEEFCSKALEVGIDGVILPDLPLDVYEEEYKQIFEEAGLHMIFLISPQTSEDRIRKISGLSRGFIYMVSAAATTGAREGFASEQIAYFQRIKDMELGIPLLIGFGISSGETFHRACDFASGAIIGSAFVRALSAGGVLSENIENFVSNILD